MVWCECLCPQKFICWNHNPLKMVWVGGSSGRCLNHEIEDLTNGISALWKGLCKDLLSPPPSEDTMRSFPPGEACLWPCWHHGHGIPASETMSNIKFISAPSLVFCYSSPNWLRQATKRLAPAQYPLSLFLSCSLDKSPMPSCELHYGGLLSKRSDGGP